MKKLIVSVLALILLAGCGSSNNDEKTIRIGASVTPHAEIIKHIQPALEEKGYKVEITTFTDYNKPNEALVDGSLDANFFQHKPYMDKWLKENKAENKMTSIFNVHFEPLGVYSVKYTSLSALADGQKISVPNDGTNRGRALQLLAKNNIITLKDGVGIEAQQKDIVKFNKKVEIIEMAAEACATNIEDVDFSVINGNNALTAKIADKVITTEDKGSVAATTFANIIAVQTEHKDDQKIKDLIAVLNTDDVKKFIEDNYKGIVISLVPSK